MKITAKSFYEKYNGRGIDYDRAYGVQCVDGFKLACQELGIPVKATPNNWADGYWIYRKQLGYSKYFDFITDYKKYKNGDWVIWKQGSKSHPSSHIAMYYQGKSFGQNQGGNRAFNLKPTDFSDSLGALRPKVWATASNVASASASVGALKRVNATGVAKSYDKSLVGTYKVLPSVGLNMRDGAGTNQSIITLLPANTKVNCYGYYTNSSGVMWLYVQVSLNGKLYTGFVAKGYLSKV